MLLEAIAAIYGLAADSSDLALKIVDSTPEDACDARQDHHGDSKYQAREAERGVEEGDRGHTPDLPASRWRRRPFSMEKRRAEFFQPVHKPASLPVRRQLQ